MTTLQARPSRALDANAHEFIATFMSHVAEMAGHGPDRRTTLTRVKTLLLAAIESDADTSEAAWSMLHRAMFEIITAARGAHHARSSHAYLQSFVRENIDLATNGQATPVAISWA
jgi:hypothetical protein